MAAGGITTAAVLEELEGHLREEIRAQMAAGRSEQEAFEMAAARIGNPKSVRTEFDKIKSTRCLPVTIGISVWAALLALLALGLGGRLLVGKMGVLLMVHVLLVTAGFLAAFLVGTLGICYLWWQCSGSLSIERATALRRAVSMFVMLSAALLALGYALGMLWTGKYRGGYWLGSIREIGSLGTIGWMIGLAIARRLKGVEEHSLMLLCAGSNVIAAMGWFGAGILTVDPGLHRFVNYWPLEMFLLIHLLFIAASFGQRWKSVTT